MGVHMLLPICAQFCYANWDSPYAKFPAFLPVCIRGVPVCVRGSDSDVSAIFPLSHAFLSKKKQKKPHDNLFVSPTKKKERETTPNH